MECKVQTTNNKLDLKKYIKKQGEKGKTNATILGKIKFKKKGKRKKEKQV